MYGLRCSDSRKGGATAPAPFLDSTLPTHRFGKSSWEMPQKSPGKKVCGFKKSGVEQLVHIVQCTVYSIQYTAYSVQQTLTKKP